MPVVSITLYSCLYKQTQIKTPNMYTVFITFKQFFV